MRDAASDNISSSKYSYMRAKQLDQKAQGLPLMSAEEVPVLPALDDFLTVLSGEHISWATITKPSQPLDPDKMPIPDLDDFLVALPGFRN